MTSGRRARATRLAANDDDETMGGMERRPPPYVEPSGGSTYHSSNVAHVHAGGLGHGSPVHRLSFGISWNVAPDVVVESWLLARDVL